MKEIKKPVFMQEAAVRPGHPWIVEIIICMGIYIVGSGLASIGQVPVMMAYLFKNKDYIQMIRSGEVDIDLVTRLVRDMPEWFTILILFMEIFLIAAYMLYCRLIEKRKFSTMGFMGKGAVRQYAKGMLIGGLAFIGAYLVCIITGSIDFEGVSPNVAPAYILFYFFGYLVQGMAEEVICRGFFMVSLSRKYPLRFCAVLSSLLFMMLHFANEGMTWLSMVNLFLFGMFMALLFVESGNIWVVGAVHSIWNFLQGNVFGVQVSGLAKQNSIFATSFQDGRGLIHGGSFGLEGGLAVTVILMLSIYIVYVGLQAKGMLAEENSVPFKRQYTESNPYVGMESSQMPSVFTETPWRPDTARQGDRAGQGDRTAQEDKTAQEDRIAQEDSKPRGAEGNSSFGEVFASQGNKETVRTMFDAEYFRIDTGRQEGEEGRLKNHSKER